jgi:hypothetical protein
MHVVSTADVKCEHEYRLVRICMQAISVYFEVVRRLLPVH